MVEAGLATHSGGCNVEDFVVFSGLDEVVGFGGWGDVDFEDFFGLVFGDGIHLLYYP